MNNEKIGLFIAKLRKDKKMTQMDLADKLHITDRAVSKWERGICMPDVSLLSELSTILDISIAELLNGEKSNKKIDNEKIINTINYTKNDIRKRTMKIVDYVVSIIIIIISIFLININIRSEYYLNKSYKSINFPTSVIPIVREYINIIKNDSGNYSEEEYQSIMGYINSIENTVDFEKDEKLMNKSEYTYNDIISVIENDYSYAVMINTMYYNTIYKMIVKKDFSKIDNYAIYTSISNDYNSSSALLKNFVSDSYVSSINEEEIATEFVGFFNLQYESYRLLLKDIIEVGDINE